MRIRPNLARQRRGSRAAIATIATGGVLALAMTAAAASGLFTEQVGQTTDRGIVLPTNQTVNPVGSRAFVTNGRIASSLSPDGTKVAALGWHDFNGFLTIMDLPSHRCTSRSTATTPSAWSTRPAAL